MNKDFIEDENNGKVAVILCGGPGSRMGSLVSDTPKTLLKVHGKPILWYIFWRLYKCGFRKIVLPLGYEGEQIEDYIKGLSSNTNCEIIAVKTGMDTTIAKRIDLISNIIHDDSDFFLLNSDTIFDFDIEKMYQLHTSTNSLITLSAVEVASPWGIMSVKDEELVGFARDRRVSKLSSGEAKDGYGLVNSGLAWINKSSLELIELDDCPDFETTLYQKVIDIKRASHFQIKGLWIPFDTPKDLNTINLTVEDELTHSVVARDVLRKFELELEKSGNRN